MLAKQKTGYWVAGLSAGLYGYLFYFLARTDSWSLTITYTLLFGGYLLLVKNSRWQSLRWLLAVSLALRLLPFFALPALSDDFYRFIWDGRLWAAGINPFAGLPGTFLHNPALAGKGVTQELYHLLNSPTHYTVYPPVPQYINWLAARLFPQSIVYTVYLLRTFTLVADMAGIGLMVLLLKKYTGKPYRVSLYAFNPLVVIELTGNLHHEALMIAFIMGFLYFGTQNKTAASALMLALAVASKLLPLMFLPFVLLRHPQRLKFLGVFSLGSLLLFLPLSEASFFVGMQDSLTLYYQKFEFNAGLYYLLREIGYWVYGYNAIALIGKVMFAGSMVLIIALSVVLAKKKVGFPVAFTLLYLVFALMALILHPWYIVLLVALAPFTPFKFALVWSYFIFFTYLGYNTAGFTENYVVVGIEFAALFIALIYDLRYYAGSSFTLNEAP